MKKFNFLQLYSEFNHSKNLQIFCTFAENYPLDNTIRLIWKKICEWYEAYLVNTCWLNNMTMFLVINSNERVNSFCWQDISNFWYFWKVHYKYERIPSECVSCILKSFEWLVMDKIFPESWYFTYRYIYSSLGLF